MLIASDNRRILTQFAIMNDKAIEPNISLEPTKILPLCNAISVNEKWRKQQGPKREMQYENMCLQRIILLNFIYHKNTAKAGGRAVHSICQVLGEF